MNGPIKQIHEKKRDILFVLATAVLLALAVNCATSYVATIAPDRPRYLLLLSVMFFLAAFLLLGRIAFGPSEYVVRLRGAIAFTEENEAISRVEIIGYSFNNDFCEYLNSFIRENRAYAKLFSKGDTGIVSIDRFDPDDLNRHTIINSVLEFTVLRQLDLHLNSYFIHNEIDKNRIVTLTRDQLGDGVLRNRVIDLITKDIKERAAFVRHPVPDTGDAVLHSGTGQDGAVYERLELELPPRSRIYRNRNGFLVVANPLFDLTIMPKYEGYATFLSPVLIPSVDAHFTPRLANIVMHIRIKRAAFITPESMEMYEWLDSFVEKMREYVSTDRLTRRLDPDLIEILKS